MKKRKLVNSFMGLYLSFLSCGVFVEENVGPIGTALAAEVDGNWYIIPAKRNSSAVTPVTKVGFLNGVVVISETNRNSGKWIIDEENKTIENQEIPNENIFNLSVLCIKIINFY